MTLIKYSEFRPHNFDVAGLAMPEYQDWLVIPIMLHNLSQIVDESNFEVARELIEACEPESDEDEPPHTIADFSHWAVGRLRFILVEPDTEAHEVAEEIDKRLSDYPILDEDDYLIRQTDYITKDWESTSLSERLDLIAEANEQWPDEPVSIMAARHNYPPSKVVWMELEGDNYL